MEISIFFLMKASLNTLSQFFYLTAPDIVACLDRHLSAEGDIQLAAVVLGGEELLVESGQAEGSGHQAQRSLGADLELPLKLLVLRLFHEVLLGHLVSQLEETPHGHLLKPVHHLLLDIPDNPGVHRPLDDLLDWIGED